MLEEAATHRYGQRSAVIRILEAELDAGGGEICGSAYAVSRLGPRVADARLELASPSWRHVGVEAAVTAHPHATAPLKVEGRARGDRDLLMERWLAL